MKNIFILLLTSVLLTGCVGYDITMRNGTMISNASKPKLNKETQMYTIKTGFNKTTEIPAARIFSIEPHHKKGKKVDNSDFFNPAR